MSFKRAECEDCPWYTERRKEEVVGKRRHDHENEKGHTTRRLEDGALLGGLFSIRGDA